mmetsp:Transcript_11699/g.26324  ORF Transcript_11699/g.26324 Transcript_11699/m.26324 type:complete len:347 (-) Transcript_11699:1781-2821(-)
MSGEGAGRGGGWPEPRAHARAADEEHRRVRGRAEVPYGRGRSVQGAGAEGRDAVDDWAVRRRQDDDLQGAREEAAARDGQERVQHRRRQPSHRTHARLGLLARGSRRVGAPCGRGLRALRRVRPHLDGDAHLAVPQGPRRGARDAPEARDPLPRGVHGRAARRGEGARPEGAVRQGGQGRDQGLHRDRRAVRGAAQRGGGAEEPRDGHRQVRRRARHGAAAPRHPLRPPGCGQWACGTRRWRAHQPDRPRGRAARQAGGSCQAAGSAADGRRRELAAGDRRGVGCAAAGLHARRHTAPDAALQLDARRRGQLHGRGRVQPPRDRLDANDLPPRARLDASTHRTADH